VQHGLVVIGFVVTIPGELVLAFVSTGAIDSDAANTASSVFGIGMLPADIGLILFGLADAPSPNMATTMVDRELVVTLRNHSGTVNVQAQPRDRSRLRGNVRHYPTPRFRRRARQRTGRRQGGRSAGPAPDQAHASPSTTERPRDLGSSGSGRRSSVKPAELPRPLQRRSEPLVHRGRRVESLRERCRGGGAELVFGSG